MMAGMIIPDGYAAAALRWLAPGIPEEQLITFGLRLTGAVTNPSDIAAELVIDWLANVPLSELDAQWVFVGASVTMGAEPPPGPTGESLDGSNGTWVSTNLPPNVAYLVKKSTALGGRRNRGRFYLPAGFTAESQVDESGGIATTTVQAWDIRMADFLVALGAGGGYDGMVILHSELPALPTLVTSLTTDARVATQRRRLHR
jgi:hypothetical protein